MISKIFSRPVLYHILYCIIFNMEPWKKSEIQYDDLKLKNNWTFYVVYETITIKKTPKNKEKDYLDNIKKLFTFSNLTDFLWFWNHTDYNQITTIFSNPFNYTFKIVKGTDYKFGSLALFKNNIQPLWEDTSNKNGGEYSIKFNGDDQKAIIDMWQKIISINTAKNMPAETCQ